MLGSKKLDVHMEFDIKEEPAVVHETSSAESLELPVDAEELLIMLRDAIFSY